MLNTQSSNVWSGTFELQWSMISPNFSVKNTFTSLFGRQVYYKFLSMPNSIVIQQDFLHSRLEPHFILPMVAQFTDVRYYLFSDLLSSLGGLYTAIYGIILLFFSLFLFKSWESSIYQECAKTHDSVSEEDKPRIKNLIKERVSFKGIYQLYDVIDQQSQKIEDLTRQN